MIEVVAAMASKSDEGAAFNDAWCSLEVVGGRCATRDVICTEFYTNLHTTFSTRKPSTQKKLSFGGKKKELISIVTRFRKSPILLNDRVNYFQPLNDRGIKSKAATGR